MYKYHYSYQQNISLGLAISLNKLNTKNIIINGGVGYTNFKRKDSDFSFYSLSIIPNSEPRLIELNYLISNVEFRYQFNISKYFLFSTGLCYEYYKLRKMNGVFYYIDLIDPKSPKRIYEDPANNSSKLFIIGEFGFRINNRLTIKAGFGTEFIEQLGDVFYNKSFNNVRWIHYWMFQPGIENHNLFKTNFGISYFF